MDHNMGGMSPPAAPSAAGGMSGMSMSSTKRYTHMTFFWGKNSEILFKMWPGTRTGHYVLALIVVFLMGVLVEYLSGCRLTRAGWSRRNKALVKVLMHTLRIGLAYLLMLAVMSFNVGVLIVAIAGHAVGFLVFGSSLCKKQEECGACGATGGSDLPPLKC